MRITIYTPPLQKRSWGYSKPQTERVENMSTEQKSFWTQSRGALHEGHEK